MTADAQSSLHDIADRVFRKSLQHPENLRAFLEEVLKDLAKGFDFSRAKLLPRDFLLDDWRGREADLLFEIPYRSADGEQLVLVCVLIEPQSQPDPRIPLRTLIYSVLYWEREWRQWELLPAPRPEFRLTPIVPLVLHTSSHVWGSNRTISDLLGGPEAFRAFAPQWKPIFWELASHTSQDLLESRDAFFQLLSVVRAEDAPADEFEPIFAEAMRRLGKLYDTDRVLWTEILRSVLTWAGSRRPREEKERWQSLAQSAQEDGQRMKEVSSMVETILQASHEEGRMEGRVEGRVEGLQKLLLRQGRKRFGAGNESAERSLADIKSIEKLEALGERILYVASWSELLD